MSKKHKSVKHNERCKECRKRIHELLAKIYGEVKKEYDLNLPSHLEEYKNYEIYQDLKKIYTKLQNYRGNREFVRAKKLPKVDYFVENPGFVVELDESQHFTMPRQISLKNYPDDLDFGFDRKRWISLCNKLNRHDNSPPYRDEQRAWYETLRDLSPYVLNLKSTVRLFVSDYAWCELNPEADEDIKKFKDFLRC